MAQSYRPGRVVKSILVLLVILAVVIVICEILGWPFLRAPAERIATERLEREVRIEEPFKLRLLGRIKLSVGSLWIGAPKQFDAPYLIDADNITVALRYSDLIRWDRDTEPLTIRLLQVERMDAYMLRNDKGATWQFNQEEKSDKPSAFPNFDTLIVQNGTAVVKDTVNEADLEMSFRTTEGSGTENAVSVVKGEGSFRGHPIQAQLETPGFLRAAQEGDSRPIPITAWAKYGGVRGDFKGSVADISDNNEVRGNFTIKGPSLGILGDLFSIVLPTTTEFTIKGDVMRERGLLVVNIDPARVGRSDLSGKFRFDTSGEKLAMKGELHSTNFVLADLGPTFGTRAEDGSEVDRPEGRIFPNRPLNLPALNKFNAELSLNFERVELGKAFRAPISPFKAYLDLNSGKLSLAKIDAKTADGSLAGTIAVDAHALGATGNENLKDRSRPKPEWTIDLTWKDINLEKWIKAREQTEAGEPNAYITGILNGRSKLKGQGNSTAELLGSLHGDMAAYVNKGEISHLIIEALGLDVAQALGLVIKGDKLLPMRCAVVDMQSESGILRPEVALIDTPITLVLMDGQVNMQEEQLNLRLVAKPENASPFTARSPILISGTFANPNLKPKAAPIAARVIGGIALAFVNPLAAIIPFLDPGTGEQSPCGDALRKFNAKGGKSTIKNDIKPSRSKPVENAPPTTETIPGQPAEAEPQTSLPAEPIETPPAAKPTTPKEPPAVTRGIPGHRAE
ncbi:MAG TPA: AsmA family protein [Methylophilaceae bacterium]|nr:AsmA family protein [Methylophilaceae bacterium]